MEQNWIIKAAKKANTPSDLVILEKPDVKKYLDGLLLKRFWPVIHNSLEASDYAYLPEGIPETELEHNVNLSRSLTFMLLDKRFLFFRGKLSCSTDGWMDA
ncbi:MAG: hypothetical protein HZA08_02845 [Nitrospirae bacterium]|nr:hypothetical protein [Nitrospirota bacterium]